MCMCVCLWDVMGEKGGGFVLSAGIFPSPSITNTLPPHSLSLSLSISLSPSPSPSPSLSLSLSLFLSISLPLDLTLYLSPSLSPSLSLISLPYLSPSLPSIYTDGNTVCPVGTCPMANAVCCMTAPKHCCPQGYMCMPHLNSNPLRVTCMEPQKQKRVESSKVGNCDVDKLIDFKDEDKDIIKTAEKK